MSNNHANVHNIEAQKKQLVDSLGEAAASLRTASLLADNLATYLKHTTLAPGANLGQGFSMANFSSFLASPDLNDQQNVSMEVDAGGKEKRKRKERPPKDPNAPKRPPSSYLLFQNEVRKEMQVKMPGKPYREVLAEISKRWTSMTDEQKAIYNAATNEGRLRYAVEKEKYDEEHGVEPVPKKAKTTKEAKEPKPAPVAAPVASASEESSGEEEEEEESQAASGSDKDSNNEDSSSSDDETAKPVAKKSKKDAPVPVTAPAASAATKSAAVSKPSPPPQVKEKKKEKEKKKKSKE